MITLHHGKDASNRVRRIAAAAEGAVFRRDPKMALETCVPAIADWLARTQDPALIVIDPAKADTKREREALMSVRRMAKYAGVDVHLVGGAKLKPMADAVVRGDAPHWADIPLAGSDTAATDSPMTPFRRAQMDVPTWQEMMAITGCSEGEAQERVRELERHVVWVNNTYQVNVEYSGDLSFAHLIIRRLDRRPVREWQHFQAIKNELVGPECEAVELYPAEKNLVDAKDHYHLWAYTSPDNSFGIGFRHGREVKEWRRR